MLTISRSPLGCLVPLLDKVFRRHKRAVGRRWRGQLGKRKISYAKTNFLADSFVRRLCKNSCFHYLSTISDQERKIFLILTVFAVICIERFFEGFVAWR